MVEISDEVEGENMPLIRDDVLEFLPIEKKSAKLTNEEPSLNTVVDQFPSPVEDTVNTTPLPDMDLFHTTTSMSPVINSPEYHLIPNDTEQQNTVLNQPFLGPGIDPDYPTLLGTDDDTPVSTWYQSVHGDIRYHGVSPRYQSLIGTDDDPALIGKKLDAERGDIPFSLEVKDDYVTPSLQVRESEQLKTSVQTNRTEMFPKGDGPGVSSKHQSPWGW
ncbi:unnamed protein product [Meganyctiphanes norvegica]|uniref:Uncharacterized protein n=1 Tax=Meganyctiphanes norvegica TaxID=48144 RepID=A0AAV2RVP1_MEGNR